MSGKSKDISYADLAVGLCGDLSVYPHRASLDEGSAIMPLTTDAGMP
ncbi:hypothetical protein JCM15831A_08630 [Asaia astilbis]